MRPYFTLASLLVLAGCGNELVHANKQAVTTRIETTTIVEADWPSTYEATGTVRACQVPTPNVAKAMYSSPVNTGAT